MTAQDSEAPPILQWDRAERRNPVSWYFYPFGSTAAQWCLTAGSWTKVNAVFRAPCHWYEPEKAANHAEQAFFALEAAKASRKPGLGLFPEILRSELHGIRAVLEAHSTAKQIQGEGNANGIAFNARSASLEIRVDGTDVYRIDRWD